MKPNWTEFRQSRLPSAEAAGETAPDTGQALARCARCQQVSRHWVEIPPPRGLPPSRRSPVRLCKACAAMIASGPGRARAGRGTRETP